MSVSNKKALSERQKSVMRLAAVFRKVAVSEKYLRLKKFVELLCCYAASVLLFVLPLAIGLCFMVYDHASKDSTRRWFLSHDILIAMGTGFVVYFFTVSVPHLFKCFALSCLLAQRYMRYKERVINIFSAAVGPAYFQGRLNEPKSSSWCREFFRGKVDETHGCVDAIVNGFMDNPSLWNDLKMESRMFFDFAESNASSAGVGFSTMKRIFGYDDDYNRYTNLSYLKNDMSYYIEYVADLFEDWSHVSGSPCGFEWVILRVFPVRM